MCVVIRGAGRSDSSLGGFGALDPENQIVRVAYKRGRFKPITTRGNELCDFLTSSSAGDCDIKVFT